MSCGGVYKGCKPGASGGGSGVVETIVAGTGITVDNTDPANPIVAATGGGGGMTPGDFVILVPTDAANFTAALAIAEASSYSGRVIIRFEAGYVLAEPLWFPGVQMPNLDVDVSALAGVDATTFPALFAGVYTLVLGGVNSRIGRVYGSLAVTAGDGPTLFATIGYNFDYAVGKGDLLAPVGLTISGTTNGVALIDSRLRGEHLLTIPTTGSGDFAVAGGFLENLALTFGGNAVELGYVSGGIAAGPATFANFKTLTLTGAACQVTATNGVVCDLGNIALASGMQFAITATSTARVVGRMDTQTFTAFSGAGGGFSATDGAEVIVYANNSISWRPTAVNFPLLNAANGGKARFIGASCTLTVDNTDVVPDYITSTFTGGETEIIVAGTGGSYVTASSIGVNAILPRGITNAGSLAKVRGLLASDEWVDATLLNSWTNIAGAQEAQYRKLGDVVYVRMAIEDGTAATLFTLPTGFRPPAAIGLPAQVHDNTDAPDFGHIRVNTNGDVVIEHPGSLSNHQVWATFAFSLAT